MLKTVFISVEKAENISTSYSAYLYEENAERDYCHEAKSATWDAFVNHYTDAGLTLNQAIEVATFVKGNWELFTSAKDVGIKELPFDVSYAA